MFTGLVTVRGGEEALEVGGEGFLRGFLPDGYEEVSMNMRGASVGPGHCRPNFRHMRQCGMVASHLMRFWRHVAHAFVRRGIPALVH
jgi:hypothetical protein